MLLRLTVSNYAIIDQIDIEFAKGFNVITGETGAGKSIMVEALGLALGNRADTTSLGDKTRKCVVELSVEISNYGLQKFFETNDLDFATESIIRREISPDGKSRAFINDTPVTLAVLKEFSQSIVDIHAQHQNLLLSNAEFRIEAVDKFAQHSALLDDVKNSWTEYSKALAGLTELKKKDAEIRKNFDFNQFQLSELLDAKLQPDMQVELENEQKVLANATEIKGLVSGLNYALDGSEQSVLSAFAGMKTTVQSLSRLDAKTQQFADRVLSCQIELKDLITELESYAEQITDDPKRLEEVESSLDKLYKLLRKHSFQTVAELMDFQQKLEEEVMLAQNFDEELLKAEKQLNSSTADYQKAASKLSNSRQKAAKTLSEQVQQVLAHLGMNEARLSLEFTTSATYSPLGIDQVNWMFSPNKGLGLQDASKTASGGELSRLMLALKAILAEKSQLPTLILDEIDTGVSGEIAAKTAALMKKSADKIQVIAITHLPQVAAKANYHLYIYKAENKGKTAMQVKTLSPSERVETIASMLSDGHISNAALENAVALIGG